MTWAVFGGIGSLVATAAGVLAVILSFRAQERERRRAVEEARRQREIELAAARGEAYAAGVKDTRREVQPQLDLRVSERDDARKDSTDKDVALRDALARVQRLEEEIRRMILQRRHDEPPGRS